MTGEHASARPPRPGVVGSSVEIVLGVGDRLEISRLGSLKGATSKPDRKSRRFRVQRGEAGGRPGELQFSPKGSGGPEGELQFHFEASRGRRGELQFSPKGSGGPEGELQFHFEAAGCCRRELQF